ncbi:hypothetical protein HMPREF7545_0652 [Selenomonas noxia ATCC 43541]|nr:hypothetical protein HMPREF7545_0652 [Selenomonas noxia ATCC 43541]
MKKKYAALFAAVFALSMIAGCGGSDKAETGATASAQPAAETQGRGLSGETAPKFTLKNLAGEDVAVEAKGKPYVSISGRHGVRPVRRRFLIWQHSMQRTAIRRISTRSISRRKRSRCRSL